MTLATLHVLIRFKVLPDKLDEAFPLAQRFTAQFRREEGCVRFEVFQDELDPSEIVILQEWEDQAALSKHYQAAYMEETMKRVLPLLAHPPITTTYRRLA